GRTAWTDARARPAARGPRPQEAAGTRAGAASAGLQLIAIAARGQYQRSVHVGVAGLDACHGFDHDHGDMIALIRCLAHGTLHLHPGIVLQGPMGRVLNDHADWAGIGDAAPYL